MRFFILLVLFSGIADAKGYKCKDSEGKTTYQQLPCRSNEIVDGYNFYQESEATKLELVRVRKEKEARKIAKSKIDAEIAESERLRKIRKYQVIEAQSKARNAQAVSSYNELAADSARIKRDYIKYVLNP